MEGGRYTLEEPVVRGFDVLASRKCPGRHLAEGTMWITIAYMLATFDMSSPKDKNGNEIKLEDVEFEEGIV